MPSGPNPNAWRNWYHAVGSTYGTWLRGDPRGFRTYRHRQHVEGDYRTPPPPGVYAALFEQSKKTLKHPPTTLNPRQRRLVCTAMAERLQDNEVELVALAIASNHFHALARFPVLTADQKRRLRSVLIQDGRDPTPRHLLGLARKHASHQLAEAGLMPPGPVWAARPKLEPIRDRQHQINTARYIHAHVEQGAAVWWKGQVL